MSTLYKKKIYIVILFNIFFIIIISIIIKNIFSENKIVDLQNINSLIEKMKGRSESDRFWQNLESEIEILKNDPKLLPFLLKSVQNPDNALKIKATFWLGNLGEEATEAIPILIKNLKDNNKRLVLHSIRALGKIGKNSSEALYSLINLLKHIHTKDPSTLNDSDDILFQEISYSLGGMGTKAKESIPFLLEFIKTRHWKLSTSVIYTLGDIAIDDEQVKYELSKLLKHNKEQVRFASAISLSKLSPNIHEGIPELIKALKGNDKKRHYLAALALSKYQIETTSVTNILIQEFQNKNATSTYRIDALKGLLNIRKDAKRVVPILKKILEDKNEDKEIREVVSKALKTISNND